MFLTSTGNTFVRDGLVTQAQRSAMTAGASSTRGNCPRAVSGDAVGCAGVSCR